MIASAVLAVGVGCAATVEDLVHRRVSNWIPATALVLGTVCQVVELGWRGAGSALGGTVVGLAVFLVFYLLGGMGGGDVKLMSGFGAILGPVRILEAALLTAVAGGVLAMVWLGIRAVRGRASTRREAIPYAPAITFGAWLALFAG